MNSLETWTKLAELAVSKARIITVCSIKLAELAGFGDQVKTAVEKVEDIAQQADARLRQEVSHVTDVIDRAISTMLVRVDVLSAAPAATGAQTSDPASSAPASPAGLDGHADLQFAELRRDTDKLKKALEQTYRWLSDAEKCFSDHEKGLRSLDGVVHGLKHQEPTAPSQPCFGTDFGASFPATGGAPTAAPPNGTPVWRRQLRSPRHL